MWISHIRTSTNGNEKINIIGQLHRHHAVRTHQYNPVTHAFLSPAVKCLLSGSGLWGTGRWSVLVCYWLRLTRCAGSPTLLLAVYKGTEVSCGDLWCVPVLTGQLQNREDQTWNDLRHTCFLPVQTTTNVRGCVRALPKCIDIFSVCFTGNVAM